MQGGFMWFYLINNHQTGPISEAAIKKLLMNQTINGNTFVWKPGLARWLPLVQTDLVNFLTQPLIKPSTQVSSYQAGIPSPQYQYLNPRLLRPATLRIDELKKLFTAFMVLEIIGIVLMVIVNAISLTTLRNSSPGVLLSLMCVFFLPGLLVTISAAVFLYMLLYRYWEVIQDGIARTTPEKAVGFSFIPFYNFYWLFPVYYGLSKDMNFYIRSRKIPCELVNEGLALSYPILLVCGLFLAFIPIMKILTPLITVTTLIMFIVLMNEFKNATSAIIEFQEKK
jgi:hypothetical protein